MTSGARHSSPSGSRRGGAAGRSRARMRWRRMRQALLLLAAPAGRRRRRMQPAASAPQAACWLLPPLLLAAVPAATGVRATLRAGWLWLQRVWPQAARSAGRVWSQLRGVDARDAGGRPGPGGAAAEAAGAKGAGQSNAAAPEPRLQCMQRTCATRCDVHAHARACACGPACNAGLQPHEPGVCSAVRHAGGQRD